MSTRKRTIARDRSPEAELERLREALHRLRGTLWPRENPEQAWDADTLDTVADILREAGYGEP